MLTLRFGPMEWRSGRGVHPLKKRTGEADQACCRKKAQDHHRAIGHGHRLQPESSRRCWDGARYEAGGTCVGLAREYGVPETTMRDFFGRVGIVMRPQGKVTTEDVAGRARLREAGWTYHDLGERLGVTRHAVMNRLKNLAPDQ